MYKDGPIVLVDGDSIAYAAGAQASEEECKKKVEEIFTRIYERCQPSEIKIYLEDWKAPKINFRSHVAVSRKYKDRTGSKKPEYLTLARELISSVAIDCDTPFEMEYEEVSFEAVSYIESEDAVAIAHEWLVSEGKKAIIARIDKDLAQVPGVHYNYFRDEMSVIDSQTALVNFYTQLLIGDATDSITGLPGVGKKTAEKLLHYDQTGDDMMTTVAVEYKRRGFPYQYLLEQARLLYILRAIDDVYQFPLLEADYNTLEVR